MQLGIAGPTRRLPGVLTEPLTRDDLVWIAPGGPFAPPMPATAVLAGVAVVVPRGASSTRALVERTLSQAGCRPDRVLEVDSVEGVKRAVRAGAGVAAVSRLAVADELEAGTVHAFVPVPTARMTRMIEVVRAEQRKPTPLERLFEHSLRDRCGRTPEAPPDASESAMGSIGSSA